jgi:predicted MPP superfamily phosphohydrolase
MSTSFGKLLEKSGFQKVFSLVILASAAVGAMLNGYAVNVLLGSLWLSALAAGVYIVLGVAALMQNRIMERWRSKRLETIMGFYTCFFIYDLVLLLLWQLAAVLVSASPETQAAGVLCIDAFAIIIVTIGYRHAKQIKCTPYSIHLGLKGARYRIVLLSDIHLGVYVGEQHLRQMAEKVNRLSADLIVICGDIIDVNNHILEDDGAFDRASAILKTMRAREGVYAVLGNHDPKIENAKFRRFLREANIRLLHNQAVRLSRLNLIGRTDASNNPRSAMDCFLSQIDRSAPTVVLDHNPSGIPEAVQQGMDLVLCGHTHRGQFFPVTYFTKLANGKHYFYGHEVFGKTHAVISAGAGFFQLPVRIGTSNEIVEIELS